MNTEFTSNVMKPGQGYVFLDGIRPDIKTNKEAKAAEKDPSGAPRVSLWSGHVMLENHQRVYLQMKGASRTQQYEVVVKQLPDDKLDQRRPDDWKTIGKGQLPLFGNQKYVEGSIDVNGRKYQVRMIKRERNGLLFNLPQVLKGRTTAEAAM